MSKEIEWELLRLDIKTLLKYVKEVCCLNF